MPPAPAHPTPAAPRFLGFAQARPTGLRYGVAVLMVGVSALLRWLLPEVLSKAPYLGFYPAVVVAAGFGGTGPGLVATFGSLVMVNAVFLPFEFLNYGLQMRNLFWIVGSGGVSLLAGWLGEARARLERFNVELEERLAAQAAELHAAQASLEQRVAARTAELAAANLQMERSRRAAVNLAQDTVAARARAEAAAAALRQSEAHLRELAQRLTYHVDNSPLAVIEWGPDMRLTRWSREAERMFGWSAAEVLGKRMEDFRWIYPEDAAQVAEVSAGLRTSAGPGRFSANRNYRKDGSVAWCEWYNSSLVDESGRLQSILSLCLDVTPRRLVEREARKFMLLADHSAEFIGICDMEFKPFYVNEAGLRLVGLETPEQAFRTPVKEFFFPEDQAFIMDTFFPKVMREGYGEVEIRFRHFQTGAPLWMIYNVFFLRDTDGQPVGLATVSRDITARRLAEAEVRLLNAQLETRVEHRTAELAASNRELEAFCYSVSHDLRAPLRTIDGFSQALLEDYGATLDKTAHDFLDRVRGGCQNMGQLIDDLLNLSRLSRGTLNRAPVDLTKLAQRVAANLRQAEPQRQVEFHIAPGLTAIGDERLLEVVLNNLLGNAWKYTGQREQAVIEFGVMDKRSDAGDKRSDGVVECGSDGGTAPAQHSNTPSLQYSAAPSSPVFFVRDNGAGFDQAYVHKLFTPFQRLHAKSEFAGTGIGLATVQRVIARHGGHAWAEGVVGQGATIYFTLGQ